RRLSGVSPQRAADGRDVVTAPDARNLLAVQKRIRAPVFRPLRSNLQRDQGSRTTVTVRLGPSACRVRTRRGQASRASSAQGCVAGRSRFPRAARPPAAGLARSPAPPPPLPVRRVRAAARRRSRAPRSAQALPRPLGRAARPRPPPSRPPLSRQRPWPGPAGKTLT